MFTRRLDSAFIGLAVLGSLASFASAQQFQQVVGALGGPSYTTRCEGVEVVDLNGDGKLDIVASTGAVFSPGSQGVHIPQIQMNASTGMGVFAFNDEAATRMPAGFAVQAGGCTAFDMEGDGDVDLLFAQMGSRQPQLLANNGAGIFTNVTATNFPVILMASPCAQFGDVDSDGDLDVAMADQGKPYRLFLNNGSGVFTDVTAANLPALNVAGAQDVSLVDIDNDYDLDLIGSAKLSSGQALYLNDGSGVFSNNNATLGYSGSSNNYEAEWADTDNDGDVDGFWISLSSLTEGASKNNLIENSVLGFTNSTSFITGTNGQDDNEVTFIDFNNDGRLDPIVGSLGNAVEKGYTSGVAFGFAYANNFNGAADPTMDGAPGDFDRDGRVDYVTAVGESGTGNKMFKNTGAVDTLAPMILRNQALSVQTGASPYVFKAMIQDSSYDDGQDFINASYDVSVEANNGLFSANGVAMKKMGGHLFRGAIDVAGLGASEPGALVTYTTRASDRNANASSASPVTFQVAGYLRYGTGLGGANALDLNGIGTLNIGQNATFVTTGCVPGASGGLLYANSRAFVPGFFGGTLLVDLATLGGFGGVADGTGTMTVVIPVPLDPTFVGIRLDFQSLAIDASQPGLIAFSNGVEATFAP